MEEAARPVARTSRSPELAVLAYGRWVSWAKCSHEKVEESADLVGVTKGGGGEKNSYERGGDIVGRDILAKQALLGAGGGGAFPGFPNVADHRTVRTLATSIGATPSQVGLAWLLAHAPNTLLVPGTASSVHLDENLGAGEARLTPEDIATLDAIAPS